MARIVADGVQFIKPRGKVDYPELGFEAGVKAMLDAQEAMLKAADANRKAWANWAKIWGIE